MVTTQLPEVLPFILKFFLNVLLNLTLIPSQIKISFVSRFLFAVLVTGERSVREGQDAYILKCETHDVDVEGPTP